jgi:hypothetical protein
VTTGRGDPTFVRPLRVASDVRAGAIGAEADRHDRDRSGVVSRAGLLAGATRPRSHGMVDGRRAGRGIAGK